jgi:transaldolase
MSEGYFHCVARETPTRFWVNNPTMEDTDRAIAAGAISCTTNPTFCSHMIRAESESAYAMKVIGSVVEQTADNDAAADLVQQALVKRVMEKFLPVYERRPGLEGLVSIQGDPHADDDPDHIVEEALRYRKLAKNFITKIPCTDAGLRAIEILIAEDMPTIVTEVFAIAQVVETCELYRRVSDKTGRRPPFYVTHITGIFDEYLAGVVKREGIEISREALFQAGCAVAREQYRIMRDRHYSGIMLGGGARGMHHFTEMVGGAIHVTINWSTAEELIAADPTVVSRIGEETPRTVIDELCDKLPDFRKAFLADGLVRDEFKDYGPVQYFRGMFVKGWDVLLKSIGEHR